MRSKISSTFDRLDFQAGLLANFADDALFQCFAGFENPAGERPVTLERFFASLDEQDFVAVEDQRADSQDGAFGVAAVIRHLWLALLNQRLCLPLREAPWGGALRSNRSKRRRSG